MDLQRLKTERQRRKIKIKDMATLTGMSRNLISQIEQGNDKTEYRNVEAYVQCLGDMEIRLLPKL